MMRMLIRPTSFLKPDRRQQCVVDVTSVYHQGVFIVSQRIGMIGLDTSHVSAFAGLLNDASHEYHVPGGRVVAAFPGGSPDFDLSIGRVENYTEELRDKYDVKIFSAIEDVAEQSDIIFIESVDGRVHASQFEKVAPYGKPVFIDKPLSVSSSDAERIRSAAETYRVPVMSCSALRFCDDLIEALAHGRDDVIGCDVCGPMAEQPTQPGLFWYGIHMIDMVVAVMGADCVQVRAERRGGHDLVNMTWTDGRIACAHGLRDGHRQFGMMLHRSDRVTFIDGSKGRPFYANLLSAIMKSLSDGDTAVPLNESLEVVRIIEAANESRESEKPVSLC